MILTVQAIMVAQNKQGWNTGDILTHPRLEHPIIADKGTIDGLLFTANTLFALSDREIKAGEPAYSTKSGIAGVCISGNTIWDKRIEAAYPAIEGLPLIPEWFIKLWAEKNGEVGAVEMEIVQEDYGSYRSYPRLDSDQCVVLEVKDAERYIINLGMQPDNHYGKPARAPQPLTPLQMAIQKVSHYANDCAPQTRERGLVLAVISEMKALLPAEETFAEGVFNMGYNHNMLNSLHPDFKTFFEQYKSK